MGAIVSHCHDVIKGHTESLTLSRSQISSQCVENQYKMAVNISRLLNLPRLPNQKKMKFWCVVPRLAWINILGAALYTWIALHPQPLETRLDLAVRGAVQWRRRPGNGTGGKGSTTASRISPH